MTLSSLRTQHGFEITKATSPAGTEQGAVLSQMEGKTVFVYCQREENSALSFSNNFVGGLKSLQTAQEQWLKKLRTNLCGDCHQLEET